MLRITLIQNESTPSRELGRSVVDATSRVKPTCERSQVEWCSDL